MENNSLKLDIPYLYDDGHVKNDRQWQYYIHKHLLNLRFPPKPAYINIFNTIL